MEESDGFELTYFKKVNNFNQLFLIRYKVIDPVIFLIILDVFLDLITNRLDLDIGFCI